MVPDSEETCTGDCAIPANRRRFLRDSFAAVATALIAVGMPGSAALAMPLEFIEGARGVGDAVSYAIPAADGAQIDKKSEVILVRWQGALYAFNLSCPHQNTVLRWDDRDKAFACPKHHSRFQPNGDYIEGSGRATRNMDRFAIVRDGNNVRVDVDKMYEADKDTAEWTAAVVKLA
ncbi:MAG TPA: Rieske 2Fe-2S domain-containing protein [Gemmatimonadaceae bacterium]|jgi:nitrite reductase/ring-hydroxylating ferredoxin subunit